VLPDRRTTYLAECYWPGVSESTLVETVLRADAAASELRRQGREVALRGTILVPNDETVFCLFDGREPDVRAASELSGVPFERILETLWFGPRPRTRKKRG
jgi:hypothetical protein